MEVYGMTHGDALVILKNKRARREDLIKALDLLITLNDSNELNILEKNEIRRLIELVTMQKVPCETFKSATKEDLLLELKEKYFASLEDSYKKIMEIDEAENYLKYYISPDNHQKAEKLSNAIETILWAFIKNKRRLIELEALTKDFQIGVVKKYKNIGKRKKDK